MVNRRAEGDNAYLIRDRPFHVRAPADDRYATSIATAHEGEVDVGNIKAELDGPTREDMNTNLSLNIYLLAIIEITIAVAVRRGDFSDSSFFGKEGRDICRLVFCRYLSLVLLRFFEVNRSIILLHGGGLSKVNQLE